MKPLIVKVPEEIGTFCMYHKYTERMCTIGVLAYAIRPSLAKRDEYHAIMRHLVRLGMFRSVSEAEEWADSIVVQNDSLPDSARRAFCIRELKKLKGVKVVA